MDLVPSSAYSCIDRVPVSVLSWPISTTNEGGGALELVVEVDSGGTPVQSLVLIMMVGDIRLVQQPELRLRTGGLVGLSMSQSTAVYIR